MSQHSHHPLIRKLERAATLSDATRAEIERLCQDVIRVSHKHDIISEGAAPTCVHLILKGWAARYKVLRDGARQITAILIPGDFCDMHVTILSEMDHGIVALTDCTVACLDGGELEAAARTDPQLAIALWWGTLVDEAILREWITNIGRRDALQALAHLFCEMYHRLKMVGLADGDTIDLPLTQEEMADAIGITPVHLNRTLQQLRDFGLIDLTQRKLTIKAVAKLIRVGDFDSRYLHIRKRDGAAKAALVAEPEIIAT